MIAVLRAIYGKKTTFTEIKFIYIQSVPIKDTVFLKSEVFFHFRIMKLPKTYKPKCILSGILMFLVI